ncbi:SUN domain-containing protein 1 isoform X2 [Eublepharis macularius]|uniref:SUN domain-containing protein 1 isoform X2 n=1 Tax=Eublepharis macularius TaxID=481883 RepID=A0AA97K8W0_EUBMA|nr:SUN domain-containing protein 1 isoform X2 [Eublepharis macularius]
MDFSHLHTYAPPQYVPENTGYTYALSSSYSSTALDFETSHKLDPVFDSPRMSRRSLRLSAAVYGAGEDAHSAGIFGGGSNSYAGEKDLADQSAKITKQRKNAVKQSGSVRPTPRKKVSGSSVFSHSSFSSHASDTSFMSTILDESSIQEQTAVEHFWGLDNDGDFKGGNTTVIQGNGDIAATESQAALSNGYTCNDCSILSERKEVLTAYSAPRMPSSRIYSRDRSQKHKSGGLTFYTSKILQVAKYSATSITSLLVQLFHMVLLKLGCDFQAHSNYCGSTNVKEILREDHQLDVNGEYFCYFLLHTLQRTGTAGWLASKKVLSLLWLAIVSPGRAASGVFWWLGTGWYQLVTLISLLNVFLLTRCLPKMFRLFLFLLPLLLLLGLWHCGSEGFLSLLPAFNWTRIHKAHWWEYSEQVFEPLPDLPRAVPSPDEPLNSFDLNRMSELEKQMAFMSEKWHRHDEEYSKMLLLLQTFQDQVVQLNDKSKTLTLIKTVVDQHLKEMKFYETAHLTPDFLALHREHEGRIVALEDLLAKLSEKSNGIQKELELTKARTASDADEQSHLLLSKIKHLELELAHMKSELLNSQSLKEGCETMETLREKVDSQIKESVKFVLFGNRQGDLPESLLQWLTSRFVSKSDLQVLLRDLELSILKNITLHMSATNTRPSSEVVTSIVNEAGISGITEAQAHVIVNNALKLYSQDKTGMVDFALESGGGSILSTRCSETYETKTALISLFGIPLWYFSQSPRVVIQPDMYPGNCWAFKGSQGYLVVRLSMMIYPTAFTVEHIPKTLSPTGNITSAPKDFSIYGLENEYQEEGVLLGQYMYNQDGESLQMFQVMETTENAFQVVELRILSNWGHTEYTCLYRFRVHGRPAE